MNRLALAAWLLAAAPGLAVSQGVGDRDLRALLSGYEYVPTPERLHALGPGLGAALGRIAMNDDEDVLLRARAVVALRYVPGPATALILRALLDDAHLESIIRRKAAMSLPAVTGAADRLRVRAVFEASAADHLLREACARSLRAMGHAARGIRQELAAGEPVPEIRALLGEPKNIQPRSPR